ncbi:MAG: YciI family protein [Actinomycetota bacterium]|nr:YciI family protein [Actinomycetota bacterium]
MSLYVVTYVHPDEKRWAELLEPHLHWIQRRLDDGSLVASGPLEDVSQLSAIILFKARDRAHVDELVADDPFVSEGLVTELTVQRWSPGFGELSQYAGG